MSVTDGAEMWRLYSWYRCKVLPTATDADRAKDMQKIAKLAEAIVTKMLSVSQIYCVYSKITGEPAMFSETVDQKDGTYMCTPPDIWILTRPYKDVIGATCSCVGCRISSWGNKRDKKRSEQCDKRLFWKHFLYEWSLRSACGQ